MKLDWRLTLAAVVGLSVGLSFSLLGHRKVLAAATPTTAHFQLLTAVVDEQPSGSDRLVPYNRVFLLDSESGTVWKYQGGLAITVSDGSKQYVPASFAPVTVESPTAPATHN